MDKVEAIEAMARAIHIDLSRRDIMKYLDSDEDYEGVATAALTAAEPFFAQGLPSPPSGEGE